MLFNSGIFLKVFLPAVVMLALLVQRLQPRLLPWFLILASLVFYGWFSVSFLCILLCSASVNFVLGKVVYRTRSSWWLAAGVIVNVMFLGYFKYLGWFSELLAINWIPLAQIALPLAISFYTFEQISYLVDCRKRIIAPASVRDYIYFVTFFPKLIAGPIIRFAEFSQQTNNTRINAENFATGLSLFAIGLAKKMMLADTAALYVSPTFDAAAAGNVPMFADAWLAVLAYTFQIYYDFSGYSDMALGLAFIFGIRLPINFYSPYKATSIIEFWRRWHMTLSRFLRDYLYFPLGGSRHGKVRRYTNLILVMGIGGVWHGAGMTFVIWGLLHGLYLAINHSYRALRGPAQRRNIVSAALSWCITFIAVMVAWVFFRAENVGAACNMLLGMIGSGNTFIATVDIFSLSLVGMLLAIALLLPNSNQWIGLERLQPDAATDMLIPTNARSSRLHWKPSVTWALFIGLILLAQLLTTSKPSPFLYFQF